MQERCELINKCNIDQRSFKAYLTRWLAATAELAPFTHDLIMKRISTSATAAIKTCTAGTTGTQCGLKWTTGTNDGSLGVGEQMAVLEIVQSILVDGAPGWVSAVKGTGSSEGKVNAGAEHNPDAEDLVSNPITTADKAGAGILTVLVLVGVLCGTAFMVV
jgi:mannan endo-1,6-alpha-mannosidase